MAKAQVGDYINRTGGSTTQAVKVIEVFQWSPGVEGYQLENGEIVADVTLSIYDVLLESEVVIV
jgi:hypothetical protein